MSCLCSGDTIEQKGRYQMVWSKLPLVKNQDYVRNGHLTAGQKGFSSCATHLVQTTAAAGLGGRIAETDWQRTLTLPRPQRRTHDSECPNFCQNRTCDGLLEPIVSPLVSQIVIAILDR